MEMFKNIRLSRGRSILRKKISRIKRSRFRGNFSSAKKIAIVWDAARSDEFQVLSQFHQKMADRNIDLHIIGYYPGKELPDKLTAVRYLTCLKQRDINYTYRPISYEATNFINTPFDILIDANFKKLFQLEYISTLSKAGFKVGIFDNGYDQPPFDLMIEVRQNGNMNNYLEQVVHYLEMINTGQTK